MEVNALYSVLNYYEALAGMTNLHVQHIEPTTHVKYNMYSYTRMLLQYWLVATSFVYIPRNILSTSIAWYPDDIGNVWWQSTNRIINV